MSDLTVYDVEATDVDVRHAQITQFAALRADENFDVIDETNLRIRRLSYIVPAPKALEITGIAPEQLDEPTLLSEYGASPIIERSVTPRVGRDQVNITWNGLQFDDELLRTTMFRNLRTPWFSSGKRISRVDLLSVVRLVVAGGDRILEIPVDQDGKKIWKLDNVSRANDITIKAHDAMGDVRATFELAKIVISGARWAWDAAVRCGNAANVDTALADCRRDVRPAYLFTHFGKPELVPVAVLATDGKKRWIAAKLDAEELPSDVDIIRDGLYSKDSPFKVIRASSAPLLLTEDEARRVDPSLDAVTLRTRVEAIKTLENLAAAAERALLDNSFNAPAEQTSEELIYSGFTGDGDRRLMRNFNQTRCWIERSKMQFQDRRLNDFASRILVEAMISGEAREIDDDLAKQAVQRVQSVYQRPYAKGDARWMTVEAAAEIEAPKGYQDWSRRMFDGEAIKLPDGAVRRHDDLMTPQMGFGF